MKAPKASDSPPRDVSQAMPRHMTMMVNRKSSRLRLRTMWSSNFGTTYHAAATIHATTAIDLANENSTGVSVPSPWLARMGVNKIIGTTAKSWKIKIPIVVRPWGESLSPLAAKAFSTIAVLLSESRKPQKIASGVGNPASVPPSHAITMTPPT